MHKCKTCNQDIRQCPICNYPLHQDVHGTWFHVVNIGGGAECGCVWQTTHLDDDQIEFLAQTKLAGYRPFKWTPCQFCTHFSQKEGRCVFKRVQDYIDADFNAVLYAMARHHDCPHYNEGKNQNLRKENK